MGVGVREIISLWLRKTRTNEPFHQSDSSRTQLPWIRVTLARILRRFASINIDATFVPHGAYRDRDAEQGWWGERCLGLGKYEPRQPFYYRCGASTGIGHNIYVDRYLYYVLRVSLVPERNNAIVVEMDVYKACRSTCRCGITMLLVNVFVYYLPFWSTDISVTVIYIDTRTLFACHAIQVEIFLLIRNYISLIPQILKSRVKWDNQAAAKLFSESSDCSRHTTVNLT